MLLQEKAEERQDQNILLAFRASKRLDSMRKKDEDSESTQNKKRKLSILERQTGFNKLGAFGDYVASPPKWSQVLRRLPRWKTWPVLPYGR